MQMPETGGQALAMLREHYGVHPVGKLWKKSKVALSTLQRWEEAPDAPIRSKTEDKLRKIFDGLSVPVASPSPAPAAQPPTPALDDLCRDLITEIRALREELARTRGTPHTGRRREAI